MDEGIQAAVDTYVAGLTREYLSRKRAEPPLTGRSPDGSAQVSIDGLGDITDITITSPDVPRATAVRIANAVRDAWRDAAKARAAAEQAQSPLGTKPAYAQLFDEEVNARYQTELPAEPAPRADPDADFNAGIMVNGRTRRP